MSTILKDLYFSAEFITEFADIIRKTDPKLNHKKFISFNIDTNWDNKSLKERMHNIALALHEILPNKYPEAINILNNISKQTHNFGRLSNFAYIIFPHYVSLYGLNDWDISINALENYTQISSAEFAVRPFIVQDQERMLKQMLTWSKHQNYHVRRLSSEGTRPRLPWGQHLNELIKDPTPIIPILENLKTDPTEYVRKSVANNLNDITKDHPKKVIAIAKEWYGEDSLTDHLLKRACRNLLKSGNQEILELFNVGNSQDIKLLNFNLNKKSIKLGEKIEIDFSLDLKNYPEKFLRIEYAIDFARNNNKSAKKIFQIGHKANNKSIFNCQKKHIFKDLSTRKHYKGKHKISLIVNGMNFANQEFDII